MIKQIKRTEPKSHSWPAEIFYKHQQAIRNEAFTSEIEPRTQLAGPCIRPEVLKLRIFKSTPVPFLAATRKKTISLPVSPLLLLTSPNLTLSYPCLILFSKAPLSSASWATTPGQPMYFINTNKPSGMKHLQVKPPPGLAPPTRAIQLHVFIDHKLDARHKATATNQADRAFALMKI